MCQAVSWGCVSNLTAALLQVIGLFTLMSNGKPVMISEGAGQPRRADIVFVRWYDSPEDDRRCPLSMRPLEWRMRYTARRSQVPVFGVELAGTVAMRICVVPNYSRQGSFLINDLAYLASADFLQIVEEEEAAKGMSAEYCGGRIDV